MDPLPTTPANLSSAQGHVLTAVMRRGEASADEVAESLAISPSAVRQHLAALKSGGFVAVRHERRRMGRPADLYHGTELGESLFAGPSTVDLTVELLGDLEKEDPELLTRLFERRLRRRVEQCRDRLAGKAPSDRVSGLAEILEAEGYMADVDDLQHGSYRLTLHSCAIWPVASRFGSACATELEFLKEVFTEAEVSRVAHKIAGAHECAFEIRPRASKPHRAFLPVRSDLASARGVD